VTDSIKFAAGVVAGFTLVFGLFILVVRADANPPGGAVFPAYNPAYAEGTGAWTKADVRRHFELLESIDRGMRNGAVKKGGPDRSAVIVARCAECHSEEKAKGDLILVIGDPARPKPLSVRETKAVNKAVLDGVMPPPGRELTPAEKAAFQ